MRYKKPDKNDSKSILEEAKREMKFTLTLPITEDSSFTIVRNIYECFRMLGDSLLTLEGIKTQDHIQPINKIAELNLKTKRPLQMLKILRKTRHNINYNGYKSSLEEGIDSIDLANKCSKAHWKRA